MHSARASASPWTKQNLDPKALERDEQECDAYARAGRSKPSAMVAPTTMDRFQVEQDLRNECMAGRGYRRG
jgi:hypothetical protein